MEMGKHSVLWDERSTMAVLHGYLYEVKAKLPFGKPIDYAAIASVVQNAGRPEMTAAQCRNRYEYLVKKWKILRQNVENGIPIGTTNRPVYELMNSISAERDRIKQSQVFADEEDDDGVHVSTFPVWKRKRPRSFCASKLYQLAAASAALHDAGCAAPDATKTSANNENNGNNTNNDTVNVRDNTDTPGSGDPLEMPSTSRKRRRMDDRESNPVVFNLILSYLQQIQSDMKDTRQLQLDLDSMKQRQTGMLKELQSDMGFLKRSQGGANQ